jgi:hypothetical protein
MTKTISITLTRREREMIRWLQYWKLANMVNLDAIQSLQQMYQARRFCPWMSVGVFSPEDTDLEFWRALQWMRVQTPEDLRDFINLAA